LQCSRRRDANDQFPSERLPLGKRVSRALSGFLIPFCIGVAAALAWQSWLGPPAAPVAEAPAAPSPDQEELKALLVGLAGVRQRVDDIAAQLAVGQEQVTRDINKLEAVEQDILDKISAPPPRPAAPARKSVPLTPLPITPLPPTPPEAIPQ
jgi:hypothetical protein